MQERIKENLKSALAAYNAHTIMDGIGCTDCHKELLTSTLNYTLQAYHECHAALSELQEKEQQPVT